MTHTETKKMSVASTLAFLFCGLTIFGLIVATLLQNKNIATLNSKGLIASQQRGLMLFVIAAVLSIALPTIVVLYFVAWRYRESNHHAAYHPDKSGSRKFNIFIWALPTAFVIVMAMVLIPVSHKLQPNKALASEVPPLNIQVVALRWKWVFIYPEQNIATVNYVQIPKDVPVNFDLTANDAPMSSFWVPNLGGQLYAMTGHVNRLNLMATENGDYPGRSAEINGAGYQGMRFTARVSSEADFNAWVNTTKHIPSPLDKTTYDNLSKPTKNSPVALYSPIDNRLFAGTIMKYSSTHKHAEASSSRSMDMPAHKMQMPEGTHR